MPDHGLSLLIIGGVGTPRPANYAGCAGRQPASLRHASVGATDRRRRPVGRSGGLIARSELAAPRDEPPFRVLLQPLGSDLLPWTRQYMALTESMGGPSSRQTSGVAERQTTRTRVIISRGTLCCFAFSSRAPPLPLLLRDFPCAPGSRLLREVTQMSCHLTCRLSLRGMMIGLC